MKASDRGRNVKSKELFGCFDEIFIRMTLTVLLKTVQNNELAYYLHRLIIVLVCLFLIIDKPPDWVSRRWSIIC